MKLIFRNHWNQMHKKSGAIDFLWVIWSFGKLAYNPRWASITILNFEFGFEIWEKKGKVEVYHSRVSFDNVKLKPVPKKGKK